MVDVKDQQAAEEYAEKLYPFSAIIGKPASFKFQCLKEARKQIKDTFLAGAAHVRTELELYKQAFERFMQYHCLGRIHQTGSNHVLQETYYGCVFCDGGFISKYPEWEIPTDKTFPHSPECFWNKFKEQQS